MASQRHSRLSIPIMMMSFPSTAASRSFPSKRKPMRMQSFNERRFDSSIAQLMWFTPNCSNGHQKIEKRNRFVMGAVMAIVAKTFAPE